MAAHFSWSKIPFRYLPNNSFQLFAKPSQRSFMIAPIFESWFDAFETGVLGLGTNFDQNSHQKISSLGELAPNSFKVGLGGSRAGGGGWRGKHPNILSLVTNTTPPQSAPPPASGTPEGANYNGGGSIFLWVFLGTIFPRPFSMVKEFLRPPGGQLHSGANEGVGW